MIYISLPVHTQAGVVAGQARNFAAFFPEARIVLHVSANARFSLPELEAVLRAAGCRNVVLNPARHATRWGGILQAHLANIAWIHRAGDASRICLHASNDMLVRPGLAAWLGRGGNFLHTRPIRAGSRWRFAAPALADQPLANLFRRLGSTSLVGSQVEGASFEAALLFELAALLERHLDDSAAYPREEVWLATAAHALGAPVGGRPYVLSEVHRFDRAFWRVLRYADPLIGRPGDPRYFPRRLIEYLMIRSGFHRIRRRLVDRIGADDAAWLARYEWMSDGNDTWRVFDRHGLFGVKRVARRPDHPLRRYIDALAPIPAPAPQPEPTSHQPPVAP
ncbi:hypothetical protein [Massilia alkalitolerans]|uniref:hypothetical protein n=1 Tax=Massilia alkalitolerans TaxID=286638 RepID=UPI0028A8DF11|nr:hypothetical protein [Massilia alkalitolerans]